MIEPPPRMRIDIPAPGRPSCEVTLTPGNCPCKACATLATGLAANFSPVTEATDPVKSRLFTVP